MKPFTLLMIACLACSVGANGYMIYQGNNSRFLQEIEQKRNKINEDMLQELLWSRMNGSDQNQIEMAKTQGYNEGINALVHKIDPKENMISNIWHLGYYRGMEQVDFVGEMKFEQGYAQGFQKGTSENMKAIQTILKSGDNIKNAIEKFVENTVSQEKPSDAKPSDQGK